MCEFSEQIGGDFRGEMVVAWIKGIVGEVVRSNMIQDIFQT